MKNTRILSAFIALTVVGLCLAAVPGAHAADRQPKADAVALLTTGKWRIKGGNWSHEMVFDKKGTVVVGDGSKGGIKWQATSDGIAIVYSDHQDLLFYPINPKGTKGMDAHGGDISASQVTDSPAPASTPATVASAPRPASSGTTAASSGTAPPTTVYGTKEEHVTTVPSPPPIATPAPH